MADCEERDRQYDARHPALEPERDLGLDAAGQVSVVRGPDFVGDVGTTVWVANVESGPVAQLGRSAVLTRVHLQDARVQVRCENVAGLGLPELPAQPEQLGLAYIAAPSAG